MSAGKGQSGCGSNLPTVDVPCLSKYPVMNAQKKREKRHTIKKGETAKLKKETERKKERKHEPWKCFCYWLVAKSRPLYSDPMDPTGFSVHGILQARKLKWVAISFSSGSSWIRNATHISCTVRQILYHCPTWKAWSMKGRKEIGTDSSWTVIGTILSAQWVSHTVLGRSSRGGKSTLSSAPPEAHYGVPSPENTWHKQEGSSTPRL